MRADKKKEKIKSGNAKRNALIGLGIAVALAGGFSGYVYAQFSNNKIAKNVYISNIDVGGLTTDQAKQKIQSNFKMKDIVLKFEDKKFDVSSKDAKLAFDLDDTVKKAYDYNKAGDFFTNYGRTVESMFGNKENIKVSITYDQTYMAKKLEEISKDVNREVQNATLELASKAAADGTLPDAEKTAVKTETKKDKAAKDDKSTKTEKNAKDDKNANGDKDAKDATGADKEVKDNDPNAAVIIPEKDGIVLNAKKTLEEIQKNLTKEDYESEIQVDRIKAKIKASDLKGIDTLLGEYSTVFTSYLSGRNANIKLSTKTSSDVLLKPNQKYSFNELTGLRTLANGYTYAPVIEEGVLKIGVGGGVCQVSSTIYNAALESGMKIDVHRNHTIPSDYIARGRDATVTDSGQDFSFINPFKHPVYIKNYVVGNKVISQIFGYRADEQHIDITTNVVGYSGAGSKVIQDPSLPAGKKVVEKLARSGSTVITYRIYKDANGKVIKTEKVATNTYPAKAGVIRVGTRGAAQAKPGQKPGAAGQPGAATPHTPVQPKPQAPAPQAGGNQ